MEVKHPYKAEEWGTAWVVTGPGLGGVGGSISSLGDDKAPLTKTEATQLKCFFNDVWDRSRRQKESELRDAFGLKEWSGQLEVARR